jgi:hypothetical protein
MKYMLLLANAPDRWTATDASPTDGVIDDWGAYTRALFEAGVLVNGGGLASPTAATAVRVRAGKRLVTDGPFAETAEHLIGYYVIECADLDVALAWAARAPNARTGTIEVRPLSPGQTPTETLARLGIAFTGT